MDWLQYFHAFWVGGLICVAAQLLIDRTKLTPARILTVYVCAGVFLSAVGLYAPLKEFAGAGATVPLTGFGHVLAEGVREAVDKDGLLGALYGGMAAASVGISSSLVFALIWSLIFKSRMK